MRIIEDIKLDFKDVLLVPNRSELTSRKEVNLVRSFKPKYGKPFTGIPILASNMLTGSFSMLNVFSKNQMFVAIAKHFNSIWPTLDFKKNIDPLFYGFYTIGKKEEELEGLIDFYRVLENKIGIESAKSLKLCVDIANGYVFDFPDYITKIRESFPSNVIMAGNVCTPEMTQQLILAGADYVKEGIGPGCLAGDTRILMSNGIYKDIKDIKVHDRVINKDGMPVEVIGIKYSGMRKVKKYKNNLFYKDTMVTEDHLHLVGDYSSTPNSTKNLQELVHQLNRFEESKIGWSDLHDNLENKVLLLPHNISFEMPETFNIDMSSFFHAIKGFNESSLITKNIVPSYDLGYLIGTFLGDGNAKIIRNKRKNKKNNSISFNTSGSLTWYFNKTEKEIAEKVSDCLLKVFNCKSFLIEKSNMWLISCRSNVLTRFFRQFYSLPSKNKILPSLFFIKDNSYLKGFLDGMIDSDGSYLSDGRIGFSNTSIDLIEKFMVVFYLLNKYFPSITLKKKSKGNLNIKKDIKDLKQAYLCRSVLNTPNSDLQYQINKVYNDINDFDLYIPTYDIEVNCYTHSFIANNSVVHNSMCETRKKTSVGYPQLSSIIETSNTAHGLKAGIVSDGGITCPGDFCKAFCAGADFVMAGSIFAGTDEQDGDIIIRYYKTEEYTDKELTERKIIEKKYKVFYGMSSDKAQKDHFGGVKNYRTSEGKVEEVEYKGPVQNIINDILGGLRSCGTYIGADSIKNFSKCATFIKVNRQHNRF